MPRQVVAALLCLALGLLMAPLRAALRADWHYPSHALVVVAVVSAIVGLWLYGLLRRKKWLWWVTVIICILGVLTIPLDMKRQGSGVQYSLYLVQCASTIGASVLLWLRDVRRWYGVSAA